MQTTKYLLILASIGLGTYWLLPGSSSTNGASAEVDDVVYLCRETKQLIKAPPQPAPAAHPQTGRETLVRALYCNQCRKWRAVPPPDVFPGNPLSYPCPKHRRPMSATGPMDEVQ